MSQLRAAGNSEAVRVVSAGDDHDDDAGVEVVEKDTAEVVVEVINESLENPLVIVVDNIKHVGVREIFV